MPEVIIVGAGPAGLRCAEILSNAGKDVLLLEKNKIIGLKVCAGGFCSKTYSLLGIPNELVEGRFNYIFFNTPWNKTKIRTKIYTIDRKVLGQWQLKKLKNVKIIKDAKITKIEKNSITINNKRIKFKYLVGADGSTSIVRKYLGLKTKVDYAVQYLVPKKYKDLEVYYDSKLLHSWYAWIFPHKDYTSIGCGGNSKHMPSDKLMSNFHKWLKQKGIDVSKAKYEAFPISYGYSGLKFGNIFLAGDAAGLASGFTGEGIYQALVSGEEVASLILNPKYNPIKIKKLLKTKKQHNLILNVLQKSGPLRGMILEMIAIGLKSKFVAKKVMKICTGG